jgi:alkylation response protein AidB-like acyl-CoA dehydrogenase
MELAAAVREVERLAQQEPAAGMARALQVAAAWAIGAPDRPAAIALSSDHIPDFADDRLTGQASWIGPLFKDAVAVVAGRSKERREGVPVDGVALIACAVPLDAPGVSIQPIRTAALDGVAFGHATFGGVPCTVIGPTLPIMARARVLLSAAGLGMGRRALHEGLAALRAQEGRPQGAGGEQTVQGLLADAATELEAAAVLIAQAAESDPPSLVAASMAKLAVTEATQRAVARATQVVGADSFTSGHILERLAQDVRALELFAGRTEALREAIANDILPRT